MSFTDGKKYNTIYADPPWRFQNRTGKVAPEHRRLTRYETMTLDDIKSLPIEEIADSKSHLYLWIPNALLPDGLAVMDAWGFEYKGNIVWDDQTDAALGSILETLQNCSSLALKSIALPIGRSRRRVLRSTSFGQENVNTVENRTNLFQSSKRARSRLESNSSRAAIDPDGICGAIRRTTTTSQPGTPIRTIQ